MTFTATAAKALPAAAALFLLLAGSNVRAQQPSQDQIAAVRASCRSDFMANCSGVQPGGKDALDCLKRNLGRLSGSCQTAVSALTPPSPATSPTPAAAPVATAPPPAASPPRTPATASPARAAAPPAAAKPQTHAVAKLTPPPPAPTVPVEATVSPPPPAAPQTPNVMVLPPREALRIVRICAVDQQALCAGVPPGGGRIIACLMRNQAALSPPCKNALAMAQSR
jgi:hypothetical protein